MCNHDVLIYLFLYGAIFEVNVAGVKFGVKYSANFQRRSMLWLQHNSHFDLSVFDSAVMAKYPSEFSV